MSRDCTCERCVAACRRMPGVFAPGEAEKAAEFLGLTFEELKPRLIQTYQYDPIDDPLIWAPRKIGWDEELASDEYTNMPGTCTFLKDERCEIHPVKPWECRKVMACESRFKTPWAMLNQMYRDAECPRPPEAFAQELKRRRIEKGYSLESLGDRIGASEITLGGLESDTPEFELFPSLAWALSKALDWNVDAMAESWVKNKKDKR